MIITRLLITLYEKVGRQLSCVPNSNIYHILTGNRLVAPDVMAMEIFWQMTPGHISKNLIVTVPYSLKYSRKYLRGP